MATDGPLVPTAPEPAEDVPERAAGSPLPRGAVILLALAAAVVTLVGMAISSGIIAPIFLALCLTITVYPLRIWLQNHGFPRWSATLLVVLGVYAILFGLVISFVVGLARLATLLPEYTSQMQDRLSSFQKWLDGLGIGADQVGQLLKHISPAKIVDLAGGLLGGVVGLASTLLFVITLVLFMGMDSAPFNTRMERVRGTRQNALVALGSFALGTRKYFAVTTIFGAIVAVLDGLALVILGVPAAALWALLAFITNYIPNVGFIIGLVPPALLALLAGGVGQMVLVIIIYCVLNFIIQSLIQPKFVGDAVGLTTTTTFLSLIVWTYVLGPLGAILAIPVSLLVKALLVDMDPDARWLQLFLGDAPVHKSKKSSKSSKGSKSRRSRRGKRTRHGAGSGSGEASISNAES